MISACRCVVATCCTVGAWCCLMSRVLTSGFFSIMATVDLSLDDGIMADRTHSPAVHMSARI